MACNHHEDTVRIVGTLEADSPSRITLEVRFDVTLPTEQVLARIRHAIDVHARPAALEEARRARAAWN